MMDEHLLLKRYISHSLILETVIAVALTWVMGQRYSETAKIMPAGVVAGIKYLIWKSGSQFIRTRAPAIRNPCGARTPPS
ncbi:hypothetical protein L2E82_51672 [Cichorium intybus]|nr:hypothetical protein L2E82_51672 [Cichorium intybus]